MTNQEKFKALVSQKNSNAIKQTLINKQNRAYLKASQEIALKIMDRLDELGWTQRKLASEMEVTPQQVNKILRGKENLTLSTIVKLQSILEIQLLASFGKKDSSPELLDCK